MLLNNLYVAGGFFMLVSLSGDLDFFLTNY